MAAPDLEEVQSYLRSVYGVTKPPDDVTNALAAEQAAQSRHCRVPAVDADWPPDLAQALCRRVAVNLGLRPLVLGIEASISDAGGVVARVGGRDPEVRRLERPWRRRPVCG